LGVKIGSLIPLLPLFIISGIMAFMGHWEEVIIACSLAVSLYCFGEYSKQNVAANRLYAGIIFAGVCLFCVIDSLRRIKSKDNFERRLTRYILEAKYLLSQQNYITIYPTTVAYLTAVNYWKEKVAKDIRREPVSG